MMKSTVIFRSSEQLFNPQSPVVLLMKSTVIFRLSEQLFNPQSPVVLLMKSTVIFRLSEQLFSPQGFCKFRSPWPCLAFSSSRWGSSVGGGGNT